MSNAIEVCNAKKEYPGFKLKDISFELPSGCIMGLIGENGAGKSTIIKLIMGIIEPDEGEIFVLGKNNRDNFRLTKEDIGVVLDETYFPESFSIKHVNSVMKDVYAAWDEEKFFSYTKRFALPEDRAFRQYSRGMKMKLAIAVALSHNAKLLILDEATSGLDPIVRDEVLDIFYEYTRDENNSILISSHIVSDLEKLCDYITFIHYGEILFCEEKDRLLDTYGVLHCSASELEKIPQEAVKGVRRGNYETTALVEREAMPKGLAMDRATVEDIIVFLGKKEAQK